MIGRRIAFCAVAALTVAGCGRHVLGVDEPGGADASMDAPAEIASTPDAGQDASRPDLSPVERPTDGAMDLVDTRADAEGRDVVADADAIDGAGTCTPAALPTPIAHYTFDDCTDSVSAKLKDSAVAGPADGTRGSGTRCVVGRFGRALYFDGQVGAEVTVPPRLSFELAHVTVAAWIRPSRATDSTILARWFVYDQFALNFDVSNSTFVFSVAVPGAGQYGDPFSVRMAAEDETWVHVAASFDGTSVRIYRNGALASELRITDPPRALQATTKSFTMGYVEKDPSTTEPRFRGDLDEVRVYATALTPAQISRIACGP